MKKLAIAAIVAAVTGDRDERGCAVADAGPLEVVEAAGTTPSRHRGSPLVDVPDATNKSALAVGKALTDQAEVQDGQTPSATVAKSIVISQNPAPGTKVPAGTEVELTVSSGPP